MFCALEIVRVYAKSPGKPAEMERPFTECRGATVLDVARLLHCDIAHDLKFARMWGANVFDGQRTGTEHPVEEGQVVELRA